MPAGYGRDMSASTVIQNVAAVATAGAFMAAATALLQARRLSRAQNFFTLAQFLQASEVRQARKQILDLMDEGELPGRWVTVEPMTDRHKRALDAAAVVASSYDLTGRVVALGYVDYEPFLEDWGPSITRMETALRPFVEERRHQNGDARYFDDFTRLAESVRSWEMSRDSPRAVRRLVYRRAQQRAKSQQ